MYIDYSHLATYYIMNSNSDIKTYWITKMEIMKLQKNNIKLKKTICYFKKNRT